MRLTAPELAARYRDGLVAEGAHVLDAGMVGTEMLYYLVGSRDLDGGLMCTASHNPKAYTGAKLVERGAVALSGDSGIGEIAALLAEGLPEAPGGGSAEDVDVYAEFQDAALKFIDPGAVQPAKVVLDGGNGMAGPMVGPILERLDGLELVPTYWEPDGEFPDHEPNPLLPENREFIIRKVREEGADLGIAWDGDADRCFFIDETGEFVAGDFLTALLAESVLQKRPGAEILYDIRASRAVADTVEAAGGRALVNRVGHAFFKTRMRDEGGAFGGEVSGHYYFADFYNADSGTIPALLILELLGKKRQDDVRAARALPLDATSSPARSTPRSRTRPAKMAAAQGALRRRRPARARRHLGRLRRLALQRAALEHRAAAAPHARVARLPGGHGGQARRGAGPHPLVIHCLSIPTPFQVGRVNCYLIEDDPLTLVDVGPNSGKALDELERALAGHGHKIEDLERIVITHQHIDHLGLVDILARRSNAEVCALDLLAPVIEDFASDAERNDELAEALMLRHGIPRDVVTALRSVSRSFRAWGGSTKVTTPLADGSELAFADRTLQVLHRPGHSPSDTLFHDRERRELIGGDHLIAHISSNPLISRPLGGKSGEPGGGRPRALITYMRSLRETREMDLEIVYPGHGEPVTDHVTLIDERFALHERRANKIGGLIEEQPHSAYEIAQSLWGNVAVTQAYLTLCEVLGHVDLLLDEGRIAEQESPGGIVRFRAAA